MAPRTILESFEDRHPEYFSPHEPKNTIPSGKASSTIVGTEEVPAALVTTSADESRQKAEEFLRSDDASDHESLNSPKGIGPPHDNETEQDVVIISETNFFALVVVAMKANRPDLGLKTFAEDPVPGRLRVDGAIKATTRSNGKGLDAVLIEYKRCWYIIPEQFNGAMCEPGKVDEKLEELEDDGVESLLVEGTKAHAYVQQTTAYSKRTRCRYVALCEYKNLVLLCYKKDVKDIKTVKATMIARHKFAKILLGFLMTACEEI